MLQYAGPLQNVSECRRNGRKHSQAVNGVYNMVTGRKSLVDAHASAVHKPSALPHEAASLFNKAPAAPLFNKAPVCKGHPRMHQTIADTATLLPHPVN